MSSAGSIELMTLYAKLTARDEGLQNALRNVKTLANEAYQSLRQIATVGLAVGGIGGMVRQFIDLESATARLGAVLSGTRHAVGLTRRELDQLSESAVRAGTATRQGAIAAEIALMRGGEVRGEQFRRAMRAAQSVSIMTGMELPQAASMLDRMLEDPSRGAMQMRRMGLGSFSQGERQRMQQMQGSGPQGMEAAQNMILNRIPNIQAPDTIARQLRTLGNELTDISTTVGSMFGPALRDAIGLVQSLANTLRGALTQEVVANVGGFIRFAATVGTFLAGARILVPVLTTVFSGINSVVVAARAGTISVSSLGTALNSLRPTGIMAIVTASAALYHHLRQTEEVLNRMAESHGLRERHSRTEESLRDLERTGGPGAAQRWAEAGLQQQNIEARRLAQESNVQAQTATIGELPLLGRFAHWSLQQLAPDTYRERIERPTQGHTPVQTAAAMEKNQRIRFTLQEFLAGNLDPGRREQTSGHARTEGFDDAYMRLVGSIAAAASGGNIQSEQLAAAREANEHLAEIATTLAEQRAVVNPNMPPRFAEAAAQRFNEFVSRPHVAGPAGGAEALWALLFDT